MPTTKASITVRRNFIVTIVIKQTFINLLTNYTDDTRLINKLWIEIEDNYSNPKRHYHNLSHLDNLFKQLIEVKDKIESWETILFTLFYHDSIYEILKSDNEEQSAELAEMRMKEINVPSSIIDNCKLQILATKKHLDNSNSDVNYFTDADLSILGGSEEIYNTYCKSVRNEFLYYPSVIYNEGRINVLSHFLALNKIYKTEYFDIKCKNQAKLNINNEIKALSRMPNEYYFNYSNQWCFNIEEDGEHGCFLSYCAELLDQTAGVEKITFYPGFFDSGYYRFFYKKVKLNVEWEGMLGIDLRTEPNPTESDLKVAREAYELLKTVRNKNYA